MKYILDGYQTGRLSFRKILKSDFDQWLDFFKDPLTSVHWVEERGSPEKECEKWYEKQFGRYENDRGGMNALIERVSSKLVGHCGLLLQTVDGIQELEIGYSLLPEFWGKGYAFEAAQLCRDIAFQSKFSNSLISIISLTNIPSEKVARKNAMKLEKTTTYRGNHVNIFRVTIEEWTRLQGNG